MCLPRSLTGSGMGMAAWRRHRYPSARTCHRDRLARQQPLADRPLPGHRTGDAGLVLYRARYCATRQSLSGGWQGQGRVCTGRLPCFCPVQTRPGSEVLEPIIRRLQVMLGTLPNSLLPPQKLAPIPTCLAPHTATSSQLRDQNDQTFASSFLLRLGRLCSATGRAHHLARCRISAPW